MQSRRCGDIVCVEGSSGRAAFFLFFNVMKMAHRISGRIA